ncbi:hypothetical protein GDO86_011218 [Hymenochirus boettgeri]|uniref:E3 ubiquitin-protein ligase RNF144B n=1 Tax=Hymenochirus boettgeri TaxID=247094 RepID=A0A8T2JFQ9_9PIPI|nr:hypothetical protein GDO86_011218 [Hymenochirus boettgeri]
MASAAKVCHHSMVADNSSSGELALESLILCKLCLCEQPFDKMTSLQACNCIFCTLCIQQYAQLAVREGLGSPITCPDMACTNQGILQEAEIADLVPPEQLHLYQRLKLEREVSMDPCKMWCPTADCHTVCLVESRDPGVPVSIDCTVCLNNFCSACKLDWHPGKSCLSNQQIAVSPEKGILIAAKVDACIKQCPVCRIYIERNEGCAQMMCKNCRHTFCWYCLQNLDNDIFLRHYDKGPCRNKLGHSRASVMWNRTQVVGILVGLGILAIVTSPLLLLASPCIICCVCKSCKSKKKKKGPSPTT